MASDATLDNAHVAEDYLARTTTMYRIIAVGRTCSLFCTLNQLNKVWHVWPGSIHGALVVELVAAKPGCSPHRKIAGLSAAFMSRGLAMRHERSSRKDGSQILEGSHHETR